MLSPEQESALTSQGDCYEHFHSSDRQVTYEQILSMISLEMTITLANGTHIVPLGAIYVLANSISGNVNLTLPNPSKNLSVTVIKTSANNSVIISSPSGTINGSASYSMTSAYQTAKFKAIAGNYYKVA